VKCRNVGIIYPRLTRSSSRGIRFDEEMIQKAGKVIKAEYDK
jgi:hypothetical protein